MARELHRAGGGRGGAADGEGEARGRRWSGRGARVGGAATEDKGEGIYFFICVDPV